MELIAIFLLTQLGFFLGIMVIKFLVWDFTFEYVLFQIRLSLIIGILLTMFIQYQTSKCEQRMSDNELRTDYCKKWVLE